MQKRVISVLVISFIVLMSLACIRADVVTGEYGYYFDVGDELLDLNGDGKIDEHETAYFYGAKPEKLTEVDPELQTLMVEEYWDAFLAGFEGYIEDPANKPKLVDLFLRQENGENVLNDDLKNKLWETFSPEKRSEYLKLMVNKMLSEQYEGRVLEEVNLNDEGQLKWVGNKLGLMNDEGKLTAWIDLDNLPRWVKKINFEEGKFNLNFDTGNGRKNIIFDGGTIGTLGELINPEGKRVGARMAEGLTSIKFNSENRQFEVKYNFKGEERTLTLDENDLPADVRAKITEALSNEATGAKIQEILGDLDGLGLDFLAGTTGGVPTQNMLNVLYGGDKEYEETIEISYDENNDIEIKASGGGTIVSTDAQGKVQRVYEQWYENKADPGDDQEVILRFDANGEIEAGRNAKINVVGFGTAYLTRAELAGVDIVRNSFIDGVLRGDKKAVLEAAFKRGEDIIDELGLSLNVKDISQLSLPQVEKQIMDILRAELENPDLTIEAKNQIQSAMDAISSNLEQSGENLIDYFLTGERTDLTADEQRIRGYVVDTVRAEVEGALTDILSNPQEVKELTRLLDEENRGLVDKDRTNEFLRTLLRNRVAGEAFDAFTHTQLVDSVGDLLRQQGTDISETLSPERINAMIDEFDIHGAVVEALERPQTGNWKDSVRSRILEGMTEKAPDIDAGTREGIADSIVSLLTDVETRVQEEVGGLQQRIRDELVEESEYTTGIRMDTYLGEVHAYGNKVIFFNAQTPLREFKATSTRQPGDNPESVIHLWSKGQEIAVFDGQETSVTRQRFRNGVSIGNIENTNSGYSAKFAKTSYGSYSLYDPSKLVVKANSVLSVGWRRAHPILQTVVQGPLEGDIAASEDSKIIMTIGGAQPTFLTRMGMRRMEKKQGGIPVAEGGEAMRQQLSTVLQRIEQQIGMDTYNQKVGEVGALFDQIGATGAEVPQIITDAYHIAANPNELMQVANFLETSSGLKLGDQVIITGSYIDMAGRRLQVSPELHRTILRGLSANAELLNRHLTIREALALQQGGGALGGLGGQAGGTQYVSPGTTTPITTTPPTTTTTPPTTTTTPQYTPQEDTGGFGGGARVVPGTTTAPSEGEAVVISEIPSTTTIIPIPEDTTPTTTGTCTYGTCPSYSGTCSRGTCYRSPRYYSRPRIFRRGLFRRW
jgi:hypothetical protein